MRFVLFFALKTHPLFKGMLLWAVSWSHNNINERFLNWITDKLSCKTWLIFISLLKWLKTSMKLSTFKLY